MAVTRAEKIRAARLRQPIEELERKAKKARERANIWTQEELDWAMKYAEELSRELRWE